MDILTKPALAALTEDELRNMLIKLNGIARPIEIVATREQLENSVSELLRKKAA